MALTILLLAVPTEVSIAGESAKTRRQEDGHTAAKASLTDMWIQPRGETRQPVPVMSPFCSSSLSFCTTRATVVIE